MTPPPSHPPAGVELTFIERVMVQHADPLKLGCDSAGVVVCFVLTWRRQLPSALVTLFGSSILGSLLARHADPAQLVVTPLGRWMLGQARPLNLVLRTAGLAFSLLGAWRHSASLILGGAGVIVVARVASNRRSSA